MRVLLTGGGSGGHIFPLIAVARKLVELSRPDYSRGEARLPEEQAARSQPQGVPELLFVGPIEGFRDIFEKESIATKSIFTGKIRRYFSFLSFIDVLQMPVGFIQAYWHVFRFMPDIVFAKGAYGSVCVVFIAWLFRIPIIIHESDSIPGLSNKILSKVARKIIISFDEAASFFPEEKTVVLGNPVRDTLFSMSLDEACKKLFIKSDRDILFLMGGSQGAQQINELLLLALPDIIKKYEVIHQCGVANYEKVRKLADLQIKSDVDRGMYHLYPMLSEEELASAYSATSIIVSRAGSGAIFEIAFSGKPSVMIPYAHAAGGHQKKNAYTYAKTGAALILEGKNIKPHMFTNVVDSIVDNPEKVETMSGAARRFAKPDAARKIAELILDTVK